MAKYYVRYNDLQTQAASLQNITKTLASLESRLNAIANGMDARDGNMAALKVQIRNCAKLVPTASKKISSGSSALLEASQLYRNAEKSNHDSVSGTDTARKENNRFMDTMWKFVGSLGIPGSIISLIGKPVAGWLTKGTILKDAVDPEYYTDVLKKGLSSLSKLNSFNTKMLDAKNLKLLGYAANNIKYPFASWITRLQAGFQDGLSSSISKYTSGGIKSFLAWGNIALTGVINGISNYNDYKAGNIPAERAVAGTILQTVFDVGKEIIVGAAATAVVGAAFGSAPVVAVAAATWGLSQGLDYVTNKLTGKDFSKAASDLILDGADYVGQKINEVRENLSNGFNKLVNCFANPFGKPRAAWAGSW